MCDGILCGKAVWRFAVGLRAYISGAMNGTVSQTMIKKRWRNVSACLQVRVFSLLHFHICTSCLPVCNPGNFETKDLHWAPDGKGVILIGKDNFCCAFEVEHEEISS
jgi:hypothetical protein